MYHYQTDESTNLTGEIRARRALNENKTNLLWTPVRKLYRAPLPPGFSQFPSCKIILIIVLLHRIHIYSSFNFVVGLTAARRNISNITNEDSTVTAQLFLSCARLLAPVAGMMADMYVPRVKMLSLCFFSSFIGSAIQSMFHTLYENKIGYIQDYAYFIVHGIALTLIAVGSSGAYALLVPVGVDQMEGANETRLKSYFSWHYWFINLGVVFVAGKFFINMEGYLKWQRPYIHLISSYTATLSIWLALIILVLSSSFGLVQRNKPPKGTPLTQVVGVFNCAVRNKYTKKRERNYVKHSFFEYALVENNGRYSYGQVQDVKTFFKILGVLVCLIWYFGVDNLYNTIFPLQATEISGADDNFDSTRTIFFSVCLTIMLVLPLIEFLRLSCNKFHFGFKRILHKILIGVVLGFFAIIIALSINLVYYFGDVHGTDNAIIIPQTIIIALSECFAFVGAMEFVYAQAPHQMIGLLFGIFQSVIGIGYYIPTIMYYILQRITSCYDNLHCGQCLIHWPPCFHISKPKSLNFAYYCVFAVFTIVYIILMVCVAKCYKRRERQKIEVWPKADNF
ncbi:Solute carrier family 15 member 4-like [Oopsacas minuta]|uniref:Solute carrier family 15 member 4-like n=1 Tax=Oopsacas minuta TaxID=111878 RepID=A0AAV7JLS4_9METZ|nr:Solute carrier family 15 member 4-like [Oopsacas minuta]